MDRMLIGRKAVVVAVAVVVVELQMGLIMHILPLFYTMLQDLNNSM